MEEKGLLTPAYIAPDSGRRYYDNHNVARIMQIEKFKSMGISNEQIINYFVRGGEATDILATLAERLHDFQRSVEELRLRVREKAGMSVQVITLPAVTCIMRRYWGHTGQESTTPCTPCTMSVYERAIYCQMTRSLLSQTEKIFGGVYRQGFLFL